MESLEIKTIELLAPAKDADTAIEAIRHGADAVYIGASTHGARSQASNTIHDIRRVAEYAHQFGAKLYVTVNTIIYDNELQSVKRLVWDLWRAGADALIVQDMALIKMTGLPPIPLHASTQCDTRTASKANFLENCGFSQIVIARELSLNEIKEIRHATTVPLEAFVHGALCVSYSGDCQASYVITGRSGNRGECAQICRLPFDLEDSDGNKLIRNKHLLSLRDMNRYAYLEKMLEAGVTSFKIEGRLKDTIYVKNVVAAYRQALDKIIAEHPYKYRRSSFGHTTINFEPLLNKSFNRGFTDYFLTSRPAAHSLATFNSPKWIGERVGKVVRVSGKSIIADLTATLNNGDGLGFFDTSGEFRGFRLNRIENNRLFPASEIAPPAGTELYRNNDKRRSDTMAKTTADRRIAVDFTIRTNGVDIIIIDARTENGIEISVAETFEIQKANSPQANARRRILEKTGDTVYHATEITDLAGDIFIPASILTALRRRATEMLDFTIKTTHKRQTRRQPDANLRLPDGYNLTRHDNIANKIAREFYSSISNGTTNNPSIPMAIEVAGPQTPEIRIMQTRYCLRRELGACLKTQAGTQLPDKLFLTSGNNRLRLEFDCNNCRMNIYVRT